MIDSDFEGESGIIFSSFTTVELANHFLSNRSNKFISCSPKKLKRLFPQSVPMRTHTYHTNTSSSGSLHFTKFSINRSVMAHSSGDKSEIGSTTLSAVAPNFMGPKKVET